MQNWPLSDCHFNDAAYGVTFTTSIAGHNKVIVRAQARLFCNGRILFEDNNHCNFNFRFVSRACLQ